MRDRGKQQPLRNGARWFLILGLSGLGAWLSGELLIQEANVWGAGSASHGLSGWVCGLLDSARLNCSVAVSGKWSQFGVPIPWYTGEAGLTLRSLDVPVAYVGLSYFVCLGVWIAFVGLPVRGDSRWRVVPIVLAATGGAMSVVFLGLMTAGLAPWCASCVTIHTINLAQVILIVRRGRSPTATERTLADTSEPHSRQAVCALATVSIILAGLWIYRGEKLHFAAQLRKLTPYREIVNTLREDPEFLLREYFAVPQIDIPPRSTDTPSGNHSRLVLFTDYECPACYCESRKIQRRALQAFGDRVEVSVRHFPLSGECNPSVRGVGHENACDAARAAEAARLLGGRDAFERMHELLFARRKSLAAELYPRLADQIGLDPARFRELSAGEEVGAVVDADIRLADALGVSATPTAFLDGRRLNRILSGPVFWKTVADARENSFTDLDYAAADPSNDRLAPEGLAPQRSARHEDD